MSKKCKCPPEGAPAWMVTYGDMVTLLLCFFVLIVSFSEIKKEDDFQAVVEEIQKAFGMKGGGGKLPTKDDPALSLIERLEAIRMRQEKIPNRSNSKDPGQRGREPRVTKIRPGMLFAVGGKIVFDPGTADLTDQSKVQLQQMAESVGLKGNANIIEVHGHASRLDLLGTGSSFEDLDQLSFERARAVKRHLTSDRIGINPERIRVIANADREPIDPRAVGSFENLQNRRAEVFVSESLVQDYQEPNQPDPM
ncbi:MAG: flagellar motor protein MotB [Planctomycetota bacterium]